MKHTDEQVAYGPSVDLAITNSVSQWLIGGLRTRKAKVVSSILVGGPIQSNNSLTLHYEVALES